MVIFISNHDVFFMTLPLEKKGKHKVEPYDEVKDACLMNKTY